MLRKCNTCISEYQMRSTIKEVEENPYNNLIILEVIKQGAQRRTGLVTRA